VPDILGVSSLDDWIKVTDEEGHDGACSSAEGRDSDSVAVIKSDLQGCVDACVGGVYGECSGVSFHKGCEGSSCECLLDVPPLGFAFTTTAAESMPGYQCWLPLSEIRSSSA
jgi:hypothetical protein